MVVIEPNKPDGLKETDDIIKNISLETDEELEDLPPMPEFKSEKEAKKYAKKLWAHKTDERIKAVLKKKKEYDKRVSDIEKEVLYREGFWDTIIRSITGREYMQVGIIYPTGRLKLYKRKRVKFQKITIKEKTYIVKKDCLLFFNGKPTLFYFENNSFPIKYDQDEHKVLVNSESLYTMFQANFVKQLFAGDVPLKTLAWTFGSLLGLGIAGYLIFSVFFQQEDTAQIILPFAWNWLKWKNLTKKN